MSCSQKTPPISKILVTDSTTVQYAWFTDWFLAVGLDKMKAVLKQRNTTSDFGSRLVLQVAEVRPDEPATGAPTSIEVASPDPGYLTGNSERCTGILDVSSLTGPNMFARLGVAYARGSNGALVQADVTVELSYEQCGRLAGTAEARLLTPDTNDYFHPITGWMPTLGVDKVKMAIIVRNKVGNFRCRLVAQFAQISKDNPGTWNNELGALVIDDNEEDNTGDVTVGGASNMFVRFGLKHWLTSGTNGGADVSVAIGVRKS